MNTQERIAILERLLDRVKRKASAPRGEASSAPVAGSQEPARATPVGVPSEPPPSSAPAPSARPVLPSVQPLPPSVPPLSIGGPLEGEPFVPEAARPQALSSVPPDSVEPLSVPPIPSVEPPSVQAFSAQAPSIEPLSVEPLPSSVPPAELISEPPAAAAAQSGNWPVGASPITAAGTDEVETTPLELLDDDIVDITGDELAAESEAPPPFEAVSPGVPDVLVDFDQVEEAPVSSRRPVATEEPEPLEAEREIPLHTPPPESGPQQAVALPPGMAQPKLPAEFDSGVHLAESEVEPPQVGATGPTAAQLGSTVELEPARGPELELDEQRRVSSIAPSRDALEASIAPSAPPSRSSEVPLPSPAAALSERALGPELTARPALDADGNVAAFSERVAPRTPRTFLELLDASLSLSAD